MAASDAVEVAGDEPVALYRLYGAGDALLYVGVTNNAGARFTEHAKAKSWWPEVTKKTIAWYDSREDVLLAEAEAIAGEHPAYNIRLTRSAARRLAARAPDRHKNHPKTVRMPAGLLAWYQERATATSEPVNALLVAALEDHRRRHDGGDTLPAASKVTPPAVTPPSPGRGRKVKAGSPAQPPGRVPFREPAPERDDCPHPKARVHKGFCGACGRSVSR